MNNLNHEFGLDLKLKLDSYRKKLGCFFFALSSPELLWGEKKNTMSLKWVHELVSKEKEVGTHFR